LGQTRRRCNNAELRNGATLTGRDRRRIVCETGRVAMRSRREGTGRRALAAALLMATATVLPAATVVPAMARPLTPAEKRFSPYDAILPACDDPAVFERIQSRFHQRETEYWNTGLEIVGFDEPGEIGFRRNGLDYIPRRYCTARAMLNDQKTRMVSYSIGEDLGIIGFSFDVDWCLVGLDRNNAYAPGCKMARP
jgi:hypothetical protein